ncbi:PREDICTED: peptidoglycan recognition protein 1-like [Nanorana parkeri]|uniref:peptidoglycan recognition protein 1-like n=1 Tax=Nanorana parkeri TaxID=125878 RepID=UPI000853F3D3|nr:PREDICTED: peptidoglycan recognition protein 1-like [Nanorana parkeri]
METEKSDFLCPGIIMIWFAVLLSVLCAAESCPTIISREEWGARNHTHECKRMCLPVSNVIIHHTGGDFCNSTETCKAEVRKIQNYHMDNQTWCDIRYNFLIGEDGAVYVGRSWTTVGAHATNYNHISIGISFIGNFTDRAPNDAALNATTELIAFGVDNILISSNYILWGHRDVSNTACPGDSLYDVIKGWPRFRA